jgi:hypothetical protein
MVGFVPTLDEIEDRPARFFSGAESLAIQQLALGRRAGIGTGERRQATQEQLLTTLYVFFQYGCLP